MAAGVVMLVTIVMLKKFLIIVFKYIDHGDAFV